MVPWFQYYQPLWFTGYDPPKTLVPAAAKASPVTTSDPVNPITTPQASVTQDPGTKYTATTAELNRMPLPPHIQFAPLPKQTRSVPDIISQVPKETSQVPLIKPHDPQAQPSSCNPGLKSQNPSQLGSSSTTSKLSQVTTINSVAVELPPSDISVAGTTLTPGAPLMTASGMLVSLGSTVLGIDTKSVPASFRDPQSLITAVGGQIIPAAATAIKIGNVTMAPGAQGTTVGRTVVSLGSGGSLMTGAKTVVLAAPSGSLVELVLGGFEHGGPSTNGSSPNGSVPLDAKNDTTSSGQRFEGKAGGLRRPIPKRVAGLAVAVYLIPHL